jgi:hypothetical protein
MCRSACDNIHTHAGALAHMEKFLRLADDAEPLDWLAIAGIPTWSMPMATEPKKSEPDIVPPVPDLEPGPDLPEIPPDKDAPERGPRKGLCKPASEVWLLSSLRRHLAPSPPKSRIGGIASGAGSLARATPPAKTCTVALCLPSNARPFCDNLLAKFRPRRSWNDRETADKCARIYEFAMDKFADPAAPRRLERTQKRQLSTK